MGNMTNNAHHKRKKIELEGGGVHQAKQNKLDRKTWLERLQRCSVRDPAYYK